MCVRERERERGGEEQNTFLPLWIREAETSTNSKMTAIITNLHPAEKKAI